MSKGILEGVRVVEISFYVAVPTAGRVLAALGAEVITIQSTTALEQTWLVPPYAPGLLMRNHLLMKRCLSLNIGEPRAQEILRKLIGKSDVFMTNLRSDALARRGLDFPTLRALNEDLIILWQTAFGSTGPHSAHRAYGMLIQYSSGVTLMSGSPDRPAVTDPPYSDLHTGMFCALGVVSALERRRRTGKGALIECVLNDAGVVTAGPAILNYQSNGVLPGRMENRDPYAAPHGAYPCRGYDRWCTIAVFSDKEWQGFCNVLGNPAWTRRQEFETLTDRLRNVDELDRLVAEWTINHSPAEVMERMQRAGVPAGIVAQGQDLSQSEHLKTRGYYKDIEYIVPDWEKTGPEWTSAGPVICISEPIHFSETPCRFGPMPRIGQDNEYVCGELLGMSHDEITALTREGVLA
ncbi:MAG: CoA transferase [Dehalococcoidia bacterium]